MLAKVLGLAVLAAGALAQNEVLENKAHHRQQCAGVYGSKDRPGAHEAKIELDFAGDNSGSISVVFFDYTDIDFLGNVVTGSDGSTQTKYLCDNEAIALEMCTQADYGLVMINKYVEGDPKHQILTQKVDLPHDQIDYKVEDTGFYCVATFPLSENTLGYKAGLHFMNAYGHLPAEQVALLPFHFSMALAYTVLFGIWAWAYWTYRADVLPVQRYVTGVGAFMIVEQFILWGYLMQYNAAGSDKAGTRAYLAVVAALGALRLTMTFFLILIVAMGYSIVFSTLGGRLRWVFVLSGALFLASTVYSLDVYSLLPDNEYRTLEFFLSLPATICVAIFYVWTLQSLTDTINYLQKRKQHVKVQMYRNLWWILLGSAIAIFAFFVLVILTTATQSLKDYLNNYWKFKWLMSDGWPNIVYFIAFACIMFIWRPTSNNRQYAMSTQLAQDEGDVEEFEIGSLNGSDYDEDADNVADLEAGTSGVRRTAPTPVFDADEHGFSELEDSEGEPDNWNRNEDRDALVDAPTRPLR